MNSRERTGRIQVFFDTLSTDLRRGCRSLTQNRGYTAVAVVILAVGIGANTAILSVADPLLLRPLPYPSPESLVALRSSNPAAGFPDDRTSLANLLDWQANAQQFEAIAGYRLRSVDLLGGEHSERLRGVFATPEFFKVFGVGTIIGRSFSRGDQIPGAQPSIILGSSLWRRRFASDRGVIGHILDVNTLNLSRVGATPRLVVGVLARDVSFPPFSADFQLTVPEIEESVDFWTPEAIPKNPNRSARELEIVGRLKRGVTIEQAQAEMDAIAQQLASQYPESNRGWGIRVVPLRDHIVGSTIRRIVLLLSLCSFVVLLIACVNVATLQLARGLARQRDVAIQLALGAGRSRIFRQTLLESCLLSITAAAVALVVTKWAISLFRLLVPSGIPLIGAVGLNVRVLLLTLCVSLITALCISIIPTARSLMPNAASAARSEARGLTIDRRRRYVLSGLIAFEVALTLMLLIGFGLMLRSAGNVLRIYPGFDQDKLLTMTISLPSNKFEWKHNVVFSRQVIQSVEALGEVKAAAVVQGVPMHAGSFWDHFRVEGGESRNWVDVPIARLRVISPNYFDVMQIPVLSGRKFDERDEQGEIGFAPQIIVSETLAKRYFPGQDALGKRIQMQSGSDRWSAIVGIAGDVRYAGLDITPDVDIYLPEGLFPQAATTLVVRTRGNPIAALGAIRSRISEIDKDAFVTDMQPMSALISNALASRRLSTVLFMIFAGMAFALAITGIYSVIAQSVLQRRLEIAVRIALGAEPDSVLRLVLYPALFVGLVGIAAGIVASFGAAGLLSTMLFQVRPHDPFTWVTVTVLMFATCLIASYIPARRARGVDQSLVLRAL